MHIYPQTNLLMSRTAVKPYIPCQSRKILKLLASCDISQHPSPDNVMLHHTINNNIVFPCVLKCGFFYETDGAISVGAKCLC